MASRTGPTEVQRREQARLPIRLRQLRWSTWRGVLVRAAQGFMKDNCTDWAAALTYYGVLALFPAAIVIVALVGLVAEGEEAVDQIVGLGRELGAGSVVANSSVESAIKQVVLSQDSAKVLLSFGLVGALWSASGYVGAFTRAANAIYEVAEGRPFYKLRPLQLLVTAVSLLLLAMLAAMLIISGPVAEALGDLLRVGSAVQVAWSIAKWPVLILVIMLLLALLSWIAPNVRSPHFRWLTVGGFVTLLAWAAVTFGFGLYVSHFGSYNATYGSLGAVIAFLVWLYLTNCAVMLGVEINAELQRGRRIQGGDPAPEDPVLEPRARPDG
jgi:membrane protein